MTKRTLRIDELLREEIGAILTREVDDPRIGFATVTDVETAPDLSHAKVWVSIIGQPDERDATLSALGRAMPFVRRQLGGRIKLRRIPELHVRLDESLQRGTRVLRLLSELESGGTLDPAAPPGESLPTPVARLPHEGDAPREPGEPVAPAPRRRRRRSANSSAVHRQRR
jgi:ribosome-binding factor A